jgi:hypothetical protein
MFGHFIEGLQAYTQVGLMVGALTCLGLGSLILGNSLSWRLHAPRVSGTIVGVIARGDTYTPVYRYTSPDGQARQAKSHVSSGAVRGKETGRVVPLMISPHDFSDVQEADGHLIDAIGALLLGTGAVLAYAALAAYPVTWMTWLMAAIMLAYLAERGRRLLIPKAQRPSYAEWRQRRAAAAAIDPADVTPIETLIAAPEAQAKLQAQARSTRKAAPLVAAFAAVLLAVGVYETRHIVRLESSGLRAQGQVVRLKSEASAGDRQSSYYPIVRFRTEKNVTVEFKDSVGSNPPGYRPGDTVTVLYNADNPRGDAIIDRGLVGNWAIPGLMFLGAALLGWLFAVMIAGRRAGDAQPPRPAAAAR